MSSETGSGVKKQDGWPMKITAAVGGNPVAKTGAITIGALFVPQLLLVYACDAWPIAYFWSVASFACGGILGFLFGVPKVLQDETTKTGLYRQLVNTNLDQISDWLTKVVVGLTLVNARNILESLKHAATTLANALGAKPGDSALALAIIVYFAVLGFMSIYILTRLYLSRAFSDVEDSFHKAQESLLKASNASSLEETKEHVKSAIETLAPLSNAAPVSAPGKPVQVTNPSDPSRPEQLTIPPVPGRAERPGSGPNLGGQEQASTTAGPGKPEQPS